MYTRSLLSTVVAVAAFDDEGSMLAKKAAVLDDAVLATDSELSDMTMADHCAAQFGDNAVNEEKCNACIAASVKTIGEAGGYHAGFMQHHVSRGRDLVRSPHFMAEMSSCLAESGAFPAGLAEEAAVCSQLFGLDACARAAGHCFAVHHPGSCSTADVAACKEDHGFLACMAHQLDHAGCNHSPIGVGGCMACGLDCLKGNDAITMATLAGEEYQTCHSACQEPPAAAAGAFELCHKYYGPDALTKCGGCAMTAKATAVGPDGAPSSCIGNQCLGIPSFIVAMTTCMMTPATEQDCDALAISMVPLPYQGAEQVCMKAFPDEHGQCLQAGAHCLALHPCKGLEECADHDGWFNCFAAKMEFDLCNMHPQGVAKCMQCGSKCLEIANCKSAKDEACLFGDAFLACHRGCSSCSSSD